MEKSLTCPILETEIKHGNSTRRELLVLSACVDEDSTSNHLATLKASLNDAGEVTAIYQCRSDMPRIDQSYPGPIKPITPALETVMLIEGRGPLPLELVFAQENIAEELIGTLDNHCRTGALVPNASSFKKMK